MDIDAPDPDPSLTTRQRLSEHRANPQCAVCHDALDPPGFAFEHFDSDGRWRDEENGLPVDATGELIGTDVDGFFDGVADLGARVAESEMAHRCFSRRWLRFLRETLETEHDECAIDSAYRALEGSGLNIREMVLALVTSDAFTMRRIEDGREP